MKYLVWKGNHGIGDRFRAMMNVFLGAIMSERILFLDWGNSLPVNYILAYGYGTNFSYDDRILGNLDQLSAPVSTKSTIEDMDLLLSRKQVIISVANSRPSKGYFMRLYEKYSGLPFSKVFRSIWSSSTEPDNIDFYHLLISKLVYPTEAFLKFVDRMRSNGLVKHVRSEMARLPEEYVLIHVRYGKGVNESNLKQFNHTHFGLNKSSISDCIAQEAVKMTQDLGMKSGRYFLATDTIEIRKNGEIYYGTWEIKHVQN